MKQQSILSSFVLSTDFNLVSVYFLFILYNSWFKLMIFIENFDYFSDTNNAVAYNLLITIKISDVSCNN